MADCDRFRETGIRWQRIDRIVEEFSERFIGRVIDRDADRVVGPANTHRFGHDPDGHSGSTGDAQADILAAIRDQAEELHETLAHEHDVFTVELVGSTGGGKTRLIEELLERAPDSENIGAIVGDVAGEDDATRLRAYDIPVENVNTGKECHLDPDGIQSAIAGFDLDSIDTLYVENVGNMVCPADFPLGAQVRLLVVSTTEGDDVVGKHPLLVQACDAAVINKIDIAEAVGADVNRIRDDIERTAPGLPVFETNARDGVGVDDLAAFLAGERIADEHNHGGHVHDGHPPGDHSNPKQTHGEQVDRTHR